jgi:hypothetical protein
MSAVREEVRKLLVRRLEDAERRVLCTVDDLDVLHGPSVAADIPNVAEGPLAELSDRNARRRLYGLQPSLGAAGGARRITVYPQRGLGTPSNWTCRERCPSAPRKTRYRAPVSKLMAARFT